MADKCNYTILYNMQFQMQLFDFLSEIVSIAEDYSFKKGYRICLSRPNSCATTSNEDFIFPLPPPLTLPYILWHASLFTMNYGY